MAQVDEALARGQAPLELLQAVRALEVQARVLANHLEEHTGVLPLNGVRADVVASSERAFSVLVVDDDPEQLALLERMLEPWFEVRTASDALRATEVLRAHPPDVVLTDLYMPHGGGLALLELARARDEALHMPVVVLSGRGDTDSKVLAFESGAFDFITKPAAQGELIARLRNALAHAQLVRRERALGGKDDLTGLSNRRTFRRFLERALRSARLQHTPVALVLADQDRLKQINDTWGHLAGDDALKTLAHALASSTRGSDCAARIGGDEFAIVVPGCDRAGIARLLSRVEEALRREPLRLPDGTEIFVQASFGVALYGEEEPGESIEALLRRADADLYSHKRARKAAAMKMELATSAAR